MSALFNPPNGESFTFTPVYVPNPVMTFGVELEFVYAVRIEVLRELARQYGLDPAVAIHRRNVTDIAQRYLHKKLMRTVRGSFDRRPNLLGQILRADYDQCDYSHWNLGTDASVSCDFEVVIANMRRLHIENEDPLEWNWKGSELVSEILFTSEIDSWFPKLQQVQDQLAVTRNSGGFTDRKAFTGLHVHCRLVDHMNHPMFESANRDVPMLLKNILILWAVYEDELDSYHPYHRRAGNAEYAESLRPSRSIQPWNPVTFAKLVYGCNTIEELIRSVFRENAMTPKYYKIGVSPARVNKDLTLEFREHRGTLDAEEITWWVKLIEAFVLAVMSLTQFGYELESPDDLVINMPMLELIGFPEEGKAYYNAKAEKFKDDRAGANDNGSDFTVDDGSGEEEEEEEHEGEHEREHEREHEGEHEEDVDYAMNSHFIV